VIRVIVITISIVVGSVMAISAGFMLLSPRKWFRLPPWLKAQGSLVEQNYETGWGSMQLRITGALILTAIGWVIYDLLVNGS
jgi:hypothetical protein